MKIFLMKLCSYVRSYGKVKQTHKDEGKIAYLHYRTFVVKRRNNQGLSLLCLSRQRPLLNIEYMQNDPDIYFESLSYIPFSIHKNDHDHEHDPVHMTQTLTFIKMFLLLRHITVTLMILRTIFNVSQKIPFPFYVSVLEKRIKILNLF